VFFHYLRLLIEEGSITAVLRQEGSITALLGSILPHSAPPPQYHENRLGRGQKRQGGVNNGSSKIHRER